MGDIDPNANPGAGGGGQKTKKINTTPTTSPASPASSPAASNALISNSAAAGGGELTATQAEDNITIVTVEREGVGKTEYSNFGNTTVKKYDATGNLISVENGNSMKGGKKGGKKSRKPKSKKRRVRKTRRRKH